MHCNYTNMLQDAEEVKRSELIFDPPVYLQRYTTVRDILYKIPGIEKVIDFGCGEGKFIKYLKNLPFVQEIAAIDISEECLNQASYVSRPKAWDFIYKRHQPLSIKIYKGSVSETDFRLRGFDAVTCIELIEHLEPCVLELLPSNIFGYIHPKVAIFTTPNSEFNVLFTELKGFRHWDHKFEWSRDEFLDWCSSITNQYPEYSVEIHGIGDGPVEHSNLGSCSQMAIFKIKNTGISVPDTNIMEQPYKLLDENNYPGRENQECVINNSQECTNESVVSDGDDSENNSPSD